MLALRIAHAEHGLALITLTLAGSSAEEGHALFKKLLNLFRRRVAFKRAFSGGELHLQIEPAKAPSRLWNIHAHGLVELRVAFVDLEVVALTEEWASILAGHDMVGSFDLRPVTREDVGAGDDADSAPEFVPVAFYVSRRVRSQWVLFDDDQLQEAVGAHRRKRLVIRFGAWYRAARNLPRSHR